MIIKKTASGVTLLEVMLVLAIGSSIILMGFRLFQGYSIEQEFRQVRYDVDLLFQAMGEYHQANCQKGTLSPLATPPVNLTKPFSVDIENVLINGQYLAASWPAYN